VKGVALAAVILGGIVCALAVVVWGRALAASITATAALTKGDEYRGLSGPAVPHRFWPAPDDRRGLSPPG
jgi:hypothetical protein